MRRSRIAWAMLALCAISPGARATKLDRSACNLLNAELAGMVATGTRDDMERGPAWAKANLSTEKLGKIRRLIELEEQLEFRCGMRRKRIMAIKARPPKGPKGKIAVPESPEKKPAVTNAIESRPDAKDAKASAPQAPAPQKRAAVAAKKAPAEKRAAAPASVATASAQPRAPTSPAKSSRRRGGAAYVSPSEVNPFFVTRYGDTQ